jgi:hypothetical protein
MKAPTTKSPAGPLSEHSITADRIWRELERATFAVISHVTPEGKPRSSGVMCAAVNHRLYVVTAPESWKSRQIATGDEVAVTVSVHRGGVMTLVAPIPPATISFHAAATVHPAGKPSAESVPKKLASLLPRGRRSGCLIELSPRGAFLTYGIGVSLVDMARPEAATARVPVC